MLKVQGRGEMVGMHAVSAVLIHHSAMERRNDTIDLVQGNRGNGGYACSYCSTDISQCYG